MRLAVVTVLISLLASAAVYAGESPQFRGPDRDGRFEEKGLLKTWPEGGPALLWTATGLGGGYASPSIAGGKIYVPGMIDAKTAGIHILNTDGQLERTISVGPETEDSQAPGPRSTPTLDGERLYMLSGLGEAYCLDIPTGKKLWSVNILERFSGQNNTWTLAESLLVDGNRVICTPGGPDAGVTALDKMTGETVWTTKGLSDQASYCSPTIVTHKGRRLLLTETAKMLVGMDADTGALLWTVEHITDYDIHAVTPVYLDGLVYYSGGYGSGGGAVKLSDDGASVTPVWKDTTLDCQHHGVVLVDGYLYGTGQKSNRLVCIEMTTGKIVWEEKSVKQGVTIFADGMLYIYEGPKNGIVHLVKPDSSGFQSAGQFKVTGGDGKHWAHPAIANGVLYVRHGDALMAYDIQAK